MKQDLEYVGFWLRTWASIIDGILMMCITLPILFIFYGESYWDSTELINGPMDFIVSWVFPIVITISFWVLKNATPGKMAISAKIVDSKTGNAPSMGQYVGRYFAYWVSAMPLCLGFFWVAFDAKKQGWHDKLAGTVVVRSKNRAPKPVSFDS